MTCVDWAAKLKRRPLNWSLGLQLQGLRELSGDRRRRKGRGCH